ncbi:hypothetical protein ACH5RR_016875 [Cinchona calisaya]|uniref:HMG box domain-containing protein n=1 Tax=Cinchona calisaya TaxID=153742 RepID=A0ABD2ZX56_9GENT
MVHRPRMRKRVHAIRRGPDGSAFQKCEKCGLSVVIALADMHECLDHSKSKNAKKLKGRQRQSEIFTRPHNIQDEPRSAFLFFMEDFGKICKDGNEIAIDTEGFERWKKMSKEERQPYVIKAEKVNLAHTKALIEEENDIDMSWVDDEADSAEVGKFDESYIEYEYYDDSEYDEYDDLRSSDSLFFWSEISDSFDSKDWAKRCLNILRN